MLTAIHVLSEGYSTRSKSQLHQTGKQSNAKKTNPKKWRELSCSVMALEDRSLTPVSYSYSNNLFLNLTDPEFSCLD